MPEQVTPKLLSWASILEENTREQAVQSAQMPFIYPHIALMPDAHLGMGATVGSVIPTEGAIMPAAIGVDIGCGMGALRTCLTVEDLKSRDLRLLRKEIERAIPLSPGRYNRKVHDDARPLVEKLAASAREQNIPVDDIDHNWKRQLGSLGGGNHFIEICADEEDRVWIFLHSGSRGIGNKIARRHIRIAKDLCESKDIYLPHRDLAYLTEEDSQFWDYIREMEWAQEFAALNRALMMSRVKRCLDTWYRKPVEVTEEILCHHNYTKQEEHYEATVWVSRKGAIDAHAGVMGLIPGSMGTRSYVVRGKGNPESLHSAPHGAGRQYSRTEARKRFSQQDLRERMRGIEYRDSAAFIDEIPDAYKPIDQVMEDSKDLVEVVHELRQLVNVKGQ